MENIAIFTVVSSRRIITKSRRESVVESSKEFYYGGCRLERACIPSRTYIYSAIAQISTRGDPAAKIGEEIKWGSKITSSCLGQVCDFLYTLCRSRRARHITREVFSICYKCARRERSHQHISFGC